MLVSEIGVPYVGLTLKTEFAQTGTNGVNSTPKQRRSRSILPKKLKSLLEMVGSFFCGAGVASTLIGPYRTSTPFPFVSTLTRKRSSLPARSVRRHTAHLHDVKNHLRIGGFLHRGDGGNRTRVWREIL